MKIRSLKLYIVWIYSAILILNFIFVPWEFINKEKSRYGPAHKVGYRWLFRAPTIPTSDDSNSDRSFYDFDKHEWLCSSSEDDNSEQSAYKGILKMYWSIQIDQLQLILQTLAIFVFLGATFFTFHLFEQRREKAT